MGEKSVYTSNYFKICFQDSETIDETNTDMNDFSHEINNLKAALRKKYRNVCRSKSNKIGVYKRVLVKVPCSPMCFKHMFKQRVKPLQSYKSGNFFGKINLRHLDPVLGVRWNIGQSDKCSTQARLIGDVSLRYRQTAIDVKQTSFNG